VTFRLGERADLDAIVALSPDRVVLATGSRPRWPDFLPPDYRDDGLFPDLREAVALMAPYTQKQPGRAVIYDQDHGAFTYAAAEFLLERFEQVTLLTPRERIATDEPLINRQGIYQRLYTKGVEVVPLVEPLRDSRFEEGEIAYANIFNGQRGLLTNVSLFTYATARFPEDGLAAPLRAAGIAVDVIGDAWAPRSVLVATSEGHRVGTTI
jgi:hypothetical protein